MSRLPGNVEFTFKDLRILPGRTDCGIDEIDIRGQITPEIRLSLPLFSAAMDTVTEADLAIALALEGGIGVLHRNFGVVEQARQVRMVKRYKAGFVGAPFALSPDDPISSAVEIKRTRGYSTVPVTEGGRSSGKLLGVLTKNDYSARLHGSQRVGERMTPRERLVVATWPISLMEANEILLESHRGVLTIVDPEGNLLYLVTRTDIEKHESFPEAAIDAEKRLRVFAAVGTRPEDRDRAAELVSAGVDGFVIDSAHGHTRFCIDMLEHLASTYPRIPVVPGNVVTAEAATELIDHGASIIKVGIGAGSICITQVVTGVGRPQASAVAEVAEVCAARGIKVIADGGVSREGDIAKAIACGADAVMVGSLFAGTSEAPGKSFFTQEGAKVKEYRGMGSRRAMALGSADRYGLAGAHGTAAEGVEGTVLDRGPLSPYVRHLAQCLKQAMQKVGARTLADLKRARLVAVSAGAQSEGDVHDLVTYEKPDFA